MYVYPVVIFRVFVQLSAHTKLVCSYGLQSGGVVESSDRGLDTLSQIVRHVVNYHRR